VPLCRLPQPAPRPLRAGYFSQTTGCQGRAGEVVGCEGALALALTPVVHLATRTGGSFPLHILLLLCLQHDGTLQAGNGRLAQRTRT